MASAPPPLLDIRAVANTRNAWVALLFKGGAEDDASAAIDGPVLQSLFGTPELLAATAPLDCIVLLDSPSVLTPAILEPMPPERVVLAVRAAALAEDGMGEDIVRHLAGLQREGYRIMLDGALPDGTARPPALQMLSVDCAAGLPPAGSAPAWFGPHLAHGVDGSAQLQACRDAGFSWFAGDYALETGYDDSDDAGSSRKRLLAMLALLARDADAQELEAQLKQDPALSYHLLKLANSAAFSDGVPVTSFGQAIGRLGRRQLQRWLQLLLYAHQRPDGTPNLLLPLAAWRGAIMETLCRIEGGDSADQDLAFMAGVFSLLDRLLGVPLGSLLADLRLPGHVEAALLRREGPLGARLALAAVSSSDAGALARAGVDDSTWWQARLQALQWAIEVARNV